MGPNGKVEEIFDFKCTISLSESHFMKWLKAMEDIGCDTDIIIKEIHIKRNTIELSEAEFDKYRHYICPCGRSIIV